MNSLENTDELEELSDHLPAQEESAEKLPAFTSPTAVIDELDEAFDQLKRKLGEVENGFFRDCLAIAHLFLLAKSTYEKRYGVRKGRPSKSVESVPSFSRLMAEKVGRGESYVFKYVKLTKLDATCIALINDRPEIGRDFGMVHALAVQTDPEVRVEAIKAFDGGGRKGLMAVLKLAKEKPSVPTPLPLTPLPSVPPSDAETPVDADLGHEALEPPEAMPPSAETEGLPEPELDSVAQTTEQETAELARTLEDISSAYLRLLGLRPGLHVQQVKEVVKSMISALDRDHESGKLGWLVEQAADELRVAEADSHA